MKSKLSVFILLLFFAIPFLSATETKKVLILVEGNYDLKSFATAEGRQLANLMGHFDAKTVIRGTKTYTHNEIKEYDVVFYIGYSEKAAVPNIVAQDFLNTSKTIVWINRGIEQFCKEQGASTKLGFTCSGYEDSSAYDHVKIGNQILTKGTPVINNIVVSNSSKVKVLATAFCEKTKKETPYIIRSDNFLYFADSPFKRASPTDRYLILCDMLHDILGEQHESNHSALVRIEDINPNSNPDQIRDIAEALSNRNVPFLIAVSPIFVNPAENLKFGLSERPEMVDALKFAVEHGATIVMHGTTHQYRGLSADDYEFWDGMANAPIRNETAEGIEEKISLGIKEFMKVGLYPFTWETPHYTGSMLTYNVVSKFFSTAVEQPVVIDNKDFGQFFPYIINKDVYGRTVFPENLGYVALSDNIDEERAHIKRILNNAKVVHGSVRDGIVSFYYHAFLGATLLEELVDGIRKEGFEFMDLKDYQHKVQTNDRVILCGSQSYDLNLNDAFLYESYFDRKGDVVKRITSASRINGKLSKDIELSKGYFYKAEPTDYTIKEKNIGEKISSTVKSISRSLFSKKEMWDEARAAVLWMPSARGAAYNDQSSFIAALKSVNIFVDTLSIDKPFNLSAYNLVIVPYSSADILEKNVIEQLKEFVKKGGNLITDRRNKLIQNLGFVFSKSQMNVRHIRDIAYITEHIMWKFPELVNKFDYTTMDEVLCEEVNTKSAVAVGRKLEKGKIIYFNAAFDPNSDLGFSRFPYLIDYIKSFFKLMPVVKRENLEFYFDPGYRQNISIETLIKDWIKDGIHIVHVAAWHEYPKYTYDYGRLVKQAHENGILVYAWVEPPQVSQKFWLDHPEWREKNYLGEDVRASWRYPVALTDEKCLSAVIEKYMQLLKAFDWDGVNLGELYFESDNGFAHPEKYSPMHQSAQKEIKQKYGFDIRGLFEPYSGYYWDGNEEYVQILNKYRVDKITYLHKRFLDKFYEIAKLRKGFEVMVTVMDSYGSPELINNVGVNTEQIIELQKQYGFLLQVEDPASRWNETPVRYKQIGDMYAAMMDRNRLLVDLNILSIRTLEEVTPFPTLTQTGTESFHLINSSALGAPRFTTYGEASVNPQDLQYFSFASASFVQCTKTAIGYNVSSPYSFVLRLPYYIHVINIDNKPVIGMRDNMYLIPAGDHIINTKDQNVSSFSTVELQPQIISFTGNLLSANYEMQKVNFSYESSGRALLSLNREITVVTVDGMPYEFEMMKGNDCCVIFLPDGKHDVVITAGNKVSFGINITSLWSTTAIVIFGSLAVIMLFLMYVILKIIRKRAE